jgi:rhodanese-related sulfurtransferase
MKHLSYTLCTVLIAFAFYGCSAQTQTALTANEFEKKISVSDSLQLLDVRTATEYNTGHIKNSLQADWNDKKEFSRRIEFIDKNKPVYIYCLAGGRSSAAAKEMRAMGYENVIELTGGINAWKAANLPLEGRTDEKQMSIEQFNTAVGNKGVVLVDFGAEWCPPCKKMEPVLKNLQANNPGRFTIVKVNGGRDLDLLKQYSVTQLPVFIIFKDGKQVWRKDGIATEKEMAASL